MSIFYKKEKMNVPISVGDKLEVTIDSLSEKGHGVALHNGFTIMIPNSKKGERLGVIVTKIMKSHALARKLEKEDLEQEISKETSDLKKPVKEKRKKNREDYEEEYKDLNTNNEDNLGYVQREDSTDITDGEEKS